MRLLLLSTLALLLAIACFPTVRADTPTPAPTITPMPTRTPTPKAIPTGVSVVGGVTAQDMAYLEIAWDEPVHIPSWGLSVFLEIYDRDGRTRLKRHFDFARYMHYLHVQAYPPNGGEPQDLVNAGCIVGKTRITITTDCANYFSPSHMWALGFPENFIQKGMDYKIRVLFVTGILPEAATYSGVHRATIPWQQDVLAPTPTPAFAFQEYIPETTPTPLPTATPWPTPTPTPTPVPQSRGEYRVHGLEGTTAAGLGSGIESWINQQSANGYRLHSIVPVSRDRVLVVAVRR